MRLRVVQILTVTALTLGAMPAAAQQGAGAPKATASTVKSAAGALPPGYVIGAADVLSVVFWRDKEMSADIRWIRSYVVHEEDGTLGTLCVYQASSPEKIREHAERVGMPALEILEVADTVVVRPDPVAAAA